MPFLIQLKNSIDWFTETTGRLLAWLLLLMMLASCLVVILRYGFDLGFIALQESVTYLHASVFLLGAAYAMKHGAHVRVDIFYRNFSARGKAWIDSLGCIVFLLPLCVYIFISSWDFVLQSWQIGEISSEPGGIPAVYLLKALILLLAFNLSLQGIAEIIRNLQVLVEPKQ
jgi:TRAP-type mannitol/chloroaromatic compound transport system permease small subunit